LQPGRRRQRRRLNWSLPLVVLLLVLVGTALAAPVAASNVGKDRRFVGTLTMKQHTVWDASLNWVSEHGQRNIAGHVRVDLVVSGSQVVSFTATHVALKGSMRDLEKIHPSTCDINTTHRLDRTGTFSVSGSLGDLALSWPMVNHQVDVGACPGEPHGTNDFHVTWGSACTTASGATHGTVAYNSHDKMPYGTAGVGSTTVYTCKGKLKLVKSG